MIPRITLVILLLLSLVPSHAEDAVWATGRVYDADGKKPLAGAVVAIYDDKNRVVDYCKTDENGEYSLAVPKSALHLKGKGGGGFFHQVSRTVGDVGKMAAIPLKFGIKAAADAANAVDPITKVGIGTASGLAQSLVNGMSPSGNQHKEEMLRYQPGVLVMKVSAPGCNDAISLARVYWMQEEIYKAGGKEQRVLVSWLDPAKMTPNGDKNPSKVVSDYLTFTEARLSPSIAEPGQTVTVTVRMPQPPEPRTPVVVVARNSRNNKMVQLMPAGDGLYKADIQIDKKFPKNDQVYCVVAYAEQDERPGRDSKAEDGINGAGMFNPEKPYVYNPLLVVSRNRAEVVLTVVEPIKKR